MELSFSRFVGRFVADTSVKVISCGSQVKRNIDKKPLIEIRGITKTFLAMSVTMRTRVFQECSVQC